MVAKVNKEIGGWDYKGYHIERRKEIKSLVILVSGDEVVAKTLGEAKRIIDEMTEQKKLEEIEFVSKRGVFYLLSISDGKVKAFTYDERGRKTYWSVTKEILRFVEPMMA